jgi:DNA repair protein RadC
MCSDEKVIARALKILSKRIRKTNALTSPGAVRDYLRLYMADKEREVFAALFLDSQHRVIAHEDLFVGTLTQCCVHAREVVKAALKHNCAAVIFSHNHSSGVSEPSKADQLLTTNLKEALALIDVRVLDHIVTAGASSMSFAERGLI